MSDTEIVRVLAMKYASFVDDRQFARMREIMSEDFTQSGPGFAASSLAEFITNLDILNNYSATFHLVGNQLGEWQNEIYQGETWGVASHIHEEDGVQFKLDMGIRYQDVIENFAGTFKYASRDLKIIWTQDLPTHS
ncbi:MAG: nuclear transport factor 2 family protein [Halioglobus sp.]